MSRIHFTFGALCCALVLGTLIGVCTTIVAQNTAVTIEAPAHALTYLSGALIAGVLLTLVAVIRAGRVFPHDWPRG